MKTLLSLVLSITTLFLSAQDSIPNFSPDRPGQTIGVHVISKNYFQIETGVSYSKINYMELNNKSTTLQYNTTLLRYGLFDNFEIRLSTGFEKFTFKQSGIVSYSYTNKNFSPLTGGMKMNIFKGKDFIPNISFIGQLSWPYFSDKKEYDDLLYPLFAFCFSNTINDYFSIAYNFGLTWNHYYINDIGIVTTAFYTFSFGVTPFDKFSFFIEPFGSFDRLDKPVYQVDCGISYMISPNLQIDILTIPDFRFANSKEAYIAGGISWRLPK